MAYKHRVSTSELPTSIQPPVQVDSSIPVIIGTSPINMGDIENVNRINLYYSYAEAVASEGFAPAANGKFNYSISEAIYEAFALKGVAPIMTVNVLDPAKHTTSVASESVAITEGVGVLVNTGALKGSVIITDAVLGTDYDFTWTSEGLLQINAITGGSLSNPAIVKYSYLDPSKVTEADIIGGIDANTDKNKGLELINEAYSRFGLVPGLVLAPGFSGSSAVASVMTAKARGINSVFKCISLHDVPTTTVKKASDVVAYKNANNLTDASQVVLWPMASLGGVRYNASVKWMSAIMQTDADNGGTPYVSPSNKPAEMDSAVLADGKEISLTIDNTEYLNGQGIGTFLNFTGGWKTRGNNTAIYPSSTDVKDRFICVRRMFDWIQNTSILTDWAKLDAPINQRLVDLIQDSNNIWLNSLAADGALVGSQNRVVVNQSENSVINLLNGKIRYHWYITPPTPAEEIEHIVEYDVENLNSLFGEG